MKKSILTLLLCFAVSLGAYAQGYSISGTVVDSQDVPIIGATVMEAGTSTGMITDAEGAWSDLVVSGPEALISISCIGYKTVTLYASEIKEEPVVLKDDTELIDDAVVIGYGTVKKSDLTGSITAIKAEEINRGAVTTATDLLKGKVPGMLVLGDGTIRIRGISSLNASNDPLVVVDGIPLNSNGLSAINPDDIESFSVLKDASSAAIYGSRAAAGVIMVTTKKASSSKTPRISYRGSVGVQHYIGKMDLMDAPELREYMDELYAGNSWALETIDRLMGDANTDWVDEITRLGETSTHNLSISGTAAKGNLPYRLSLGYIQRIGTTLGSWSHMPNASVTLSPTFLDEHLTVTLDAKVNSRISSPQSASYMAAAEFDPSQPIYFYNADGSIDYSINDGYYVKGTMSDGKFVPASEAETNPMQYATNDYRRHNFGYIVSGVVNYKVHGFEDLSFNLRLSSDGTSSETWSRPKPNYWEVIIDSYAPGTGTNTNSAARYGNEMLEFYANYQHDFSGHNLNLMGGYSWQHFGVYTSNAQYYNADGVNAKGEPVVGGTEVVPSTARYEENFLVSFYGRLNYSFKSRYMFTATLRYDGSSRFAPDTRWGLFPSLAAAWNIKNENFLKNEESVDELKLRVGWGVTGQQNGIANYSYIPNYLLDTGSGGLKYIYNMGTDGRVNYIVPQPYEPNTRWEQTATANVGVDFSFFDGLIAGNIDLYQRDTKDLLNEVKIPMGSNFSNKVLTNIGSMVNRGVEIGLTSNPISTPEMSLLTPEAKRRLQAIETFSDLGSGFNIAMQDLDIRGAGNMLGAEQSGFIADLGYETYQKILNEAVTELKEEEFSDLYKEELEDTGNNTFYVSDCVLESDLELCFPAEYIENVSERISLYQELDNLNNESELETFKGKLIDRFGAIPAAGEDLMQALRLRWIAQRLGIEKLVLKGGKMSAFLVSNMNSSYYQSDTFGKLLRYAVNHPRQCQLREQNDKRSIVISNVDSVNKAWNILSEIEHEKNT